MYSFLKNTFSAVCIFDYLLFSLLFLEEVKVFLDNFLVRLSFLLYFLYSYL